MPEIPTIPLPTFLPRPGEQLQPILPRDHNALSISARAHPCTPEGHAPGHILTTG
jgi:hypothetical protein